MTDDEHEWMELRVPFVVCKSQNGPYDDDAFVAGFRAGEVHEQLRTAIVPFTLAIEPELAPLIDLLAMDAGWVMETIQEDADWAMVNLRRASDPEDEK